MSNINSGSLTKFAALGLLTVGTLAIGTDRAMAVCDGVEVYAGSAPEASLDELLNNPDCGFRVNGPDLDVDGNDDPGVFSTDFFKANFSLQFEIAGDRDDLEFGIYDVSSMIEKAIFGPLADPIADVGVDPGDNVKSRKVGSKFFDGFGDTFGFYLKNDDKTFYSEKAKNGGVDMAKIFAGDGESKFDLQQDGEKPYRRFKEDDLIVAFEDRLTGDFDFNDSVVYVKRKPAPADVPEPATVLGLAAVAGAFGLMRKRDR